MQWVLLTSLKNPIISTAVSVAWQPIKAAEESARGSASLFPDSAQVINAPQALPLRN